MNLLFATHGAKRRPPTFLVFCILTFTFLSGCKST